jgi:predicted RecB family nuclease
MRLVNRTVTFSATDLVTFLGCRHATYLDVRDLPSPTEAPADDAFLALLQAKGLAHERRHLHALRVAGKVVVDLSEGSYRDRVMRTRQAMAAGVQVIYQGALQSERWHGYADFLTRVPGTSALGGFAYEPVDTKLASVAQPKHALQLAVYGRLLAQVQGTLPERLHIVVGDGSVQTVRTLELHHYAEIARLRLEAFVDALPARSVAEPCAHCANCRWSARCEAEWTDADHLSVVAGITQGQRAKLQVAGVPTMAALATTTIGRISGMQPEVLARLKAQAALQVAKRSDGRDRVELLPTVAGRGFATAATRPGGFVLRHGGRPAVRGWSRVLVRLRRRGRG